MRKLGFVGIMALVIMLASTLTVTEGFARTLGGTPGHGTQKNFDSAVLQAVSAPLSANCLGLGLVPNDFTGRSHGSATIDGQSVYVHVQNAAPNIVYTASIGYLKSNGCNGTWKSLGSFSTDQAGNGQLAAHFKLGSNEYMVEVLNGDGSIAYATSFMFM
jgi:hypothetical protein